MNRTHKILLICALAFCVVIAAALMLADDRPAPRGAAFKAPAWLTRAGQGFSGHTPRIALPGKRLMIDAGKSLIIEVGPGNAGFRGASLRLEQGPVVDIAYADRTPGALVELRHQQASLPHGQAGDPRQTSIIAMKQGGTLTLHCRGTARCVLSAK